MVQFWRAAALVVTLLCAVAWGTAPASAASMHLHRGSHGSQVRTLEVRLHQLHLLGSSQVDRRYRGATVRAVKRFQRQLHRRATGKVNLRTWNLVASEVRRRTAPPPPRPRPVTTPPAPTILGHRGARVAGIPENTMASMHYAADKADVLEFDLQLTSDHRFVLMHDATLDRTTSCTGPVESRTLEYIETSCVVDLGAQSSPNERVPTFDEVAQYAASVSRSIAPEVKDSSVSDSDLAQLVTVVQQNRLSSRTFVQCFDPAVFPRLRALDSRLTYVFLTTSATSPATVKGTGATIAGPRVSGLTTAKVAAFRAAGLKVWAWTASSSAQLKSLWDMRVDGVFTDIPDTARRMYHPA